MHTDLKYFLCTGRKLTLDDQHFTPYVVRAFYFGCLGDLQAIGKHTSYYCLPGIRIHNDWMLARVGKWICITETGAYAENILEFAMNYTEIAMEPDSWAGL